MSTYSNAQLMPVSEKLGLVRLEASKRLMGWVLYSGSIYSVSVTETVIAEVADSGTALTESATLAGVTAGKWYLDREASVLYVRTSDSVNPNGKFIHAKFKLYYASGAFHGPHDMASGFDVEWLPLLDGTSDFGFELDNQNQLGVAIEGSGSIKLLNDQSYWSPRYDKYYFENQLCEVYSWVRGLPITEAKIIYRGRVQAKSWTPAQITFSLKDFLNELRAPVPLSDISLIPGARVTDRQLTAKQRRIYGYATSIVPMNIDQVLDGYPLTGTFSVTTGSSTLTGTGTAFLQELSPDDEIYIGDDEDAVTIQSVTNDTTAVLASAYSPIAQSSVTARINPSHPKKYINREWKVAGHALTEPTTTVTAAISLSRIEVASTNGLRVGDEIEVNGETTGIRRISGSQLTLTTALSFSPTVGMSVERSSITNVRINDRLLVLDRDYTYSATNGTLTLDQLAEKNVAPELFLTGTVTFTTGNRTVTGTSTFFKTDLAPGHWIRANGQVDYWEVLSVQSDTSLTLRTAPTYSNTGAAVVKRPEVYNDETTLSCDVLGVSDDGTIGGDLLYRAPEIVKDLLQVAGVSSSINAASFTTSNDLTAHRVGFAIPEKFDDTRSPKVRDVINKINQSVFGSLIQNADLELAYSVLEPERVGGITSVNETDIIKLAVKSVSDKISKTARVEYLQREYDYIAKQASILAETATSENAQYLAESINEFIMKTLLVDEASARIFAYRWAVILEVATSSLKFETKLQLSRASVNQKIQVNHEKLYQRIGGATGSKVAAVQSARKSVTDSQVELEDLANSFTRMASITVDTALDYSGAPDSERLLNGYITDNYGMMANDAETFGINLIW